MKVSIIKSLSIFSSLICIYLIFSSSNSGVSGKSTTGCGGSGCHQPSSSVTILVSGIPSTGYVPGNTYLLTLTVSSSNASATAAGFNLTVNTGTLQAGNGTTLISISELTHTAKKDFVGNVTTWNFNWIAPNDASSPLIVFVAANAVNSNNNANGDGFDTNNFSFLPSVLATTPTVNNLSVNNINANSAKVEGAVVGNYSNNNIEIEYGLTSQYGSSAFCTPAKALGDTATHFEATLSGLNSNTLYHYRVKIIYSVMPLQTGTVYSSDSTFKTLNALSVNNLNENKILISPNPFGNFLEIATVEDNKNIKFYIHSLLGVSIPIVVSQKSSTTYILDTKNIPLGYYILTASNGRYSEQMMIQKMQN